MGRERNRRVQKQVLEFRHVYLNTQEEKWAVDAEDWAPNGAQCEDTLPRVVQLRAGSCCNHPLVVPQSCYVRSPCGSFKGSG